ncbi:MAG: diguanylate cyclase [Tissierellia bacterium]|nr:diguanylate cyclase [Tissierellia bacterium]
MDIINNRFRIVDSVEGGEVLIVHDLAENNLVKEMKIFEKGELPKSMIDFLKEEFLVLSSLKIPYHIKSYNFGLVFQVDGKSENIGRTLLTRERLKYKKRILESLEEDYSLDRAAESISQVLLGISCINNRGYIYNDFNPDRIYNVSDEGINIKLHDIVEIKMEEKPGEHLYLKDIDKFDSVKLSELLLSILLARKLTRYDVDMASLRENPLKLVNRQEEERLEIILDFIDYIRGADDLGRNLHLAIKKFFTLLDLDEGAVVGEKSIKIHSRPKLVSRAKEISTILESVKDFSEKKFIGIKAGKGLGKTRLLQDIDFLLKIEGIEAHTFFEKSKKDTEDEIMEGFMRRIFSLYDEGAVKKFKSCEEDEFDILNYSNLYFLQTDDGLNRRYIKSLEIAKEELFSKYESKPAIFIIDDIDLRSETLKTIIKKINEVEKMQISFIYSFKDDEGVKDVFSNSQVIELGLLNEFETVKLIENILSIDEIDRSISDKIYEKTGGLPYLIMEAVKALAIQDIISIKPCGKAPINTAKAIEYLEEGVDSKRMAKTLYDNLYDKPISLLELISVFSKGISRNEISFLLQSKEENDQEIERLLDAGIIYPIYNYGIRKFYISNEDLSKIIYENMEDEDKKLLHMKILSSLSEDKANHKRILHHLDRLNHDDRFIGLCIDLSKKSRVARDLDSSIQFKKYALEKFQSPLKRAEILYNLILDYNNYDDIEKMQEMLDKIGHEDNCKEVLAYKELGGYAIDLVKRKLVVKDSFPVTEEENSFLYIEYLRYLGTELSMTGKFDEAKEIFENIFEKTKDIQELEITLAAALKEYGYIEFLVSRSKSDYLGYNRASKIYEECSKIASNNGEIITLYGCLNNHAASRYQMADYEGAESLYKEVIRDGGLYGVKRSVTFAKINLTNVYQTINRQDEAYELMSSSIESIKAQKQSFYLYNSYLTMSSILIDMNRLIEAREYLDMAKELLETEGGDAFIYYDREIVFNFIIGDYRSALENNLKHLAHIAQMSAPELAGSNFFDNAIKILLDDRYSIDEMSSTIKKIFKKEFLGNDLNLYTFFWFFKKIYDVPDFKGKEYLLNEIMKYKDNIDPQVENNFLPINVQAFYEYFKGLYGIDKEKNFHKSITKFLESPYTLERLFVMFDLAKFYLEEGEDSLVQFTLLECIYSLKYFFKGIDEEYKETIVMVNGFNKIYELFESLEKGISPEEIKFSLKDFLNKDYSKYGEDLKIKRAAKENYKRRMGNYISEKDLLDEINTEPSKNLQLLIDRISSKALASNVFLFVWEDDELILHYKRQNFSHEAFDGEFLEKVQTQEEFEVGKKGRIGRRKFLSFPVDSGKTGYLLVEFNRFIVNDDANTIKYIKKLMGFLDMLIKAEADRSVAYIDKLTGALSRKRFQDIARSKLENAKNDNKDISFAILDIDRFKRVNDIFGHNIGDIVLRRVAQTTMDNIGNNQLGRIGGEEFMILLDGKNKKSAFNYVEKIRNKISELSFDDIEGGMKVTISLGVSSYPVDGESYNELYEKADRAMYISKNTGRNKTTAYEEGLTEKTTGTDDVQGILKADELERVRNVRNIVENLKIAASCMPYEEKINKQLKNILEVMNAEELSLVFVDDRETVSVCLDEDEKNKNVINENLIMQVKKTKKPTFVIGRERTSSSLVKIPEWTSILVSPVFYFGEMKGILYIKTQAKIKEYGESDLSLIENLGAILAKEL